MIEKKETTDFTKRNKAKKKLSKRNYEPTTGEKIPVNQSWKETALA